jgi:tRNA-dihydrouridine synthase B
MNFWQKLNKKEDPILALAPMAGYTDSAFRLICKDFGSDVVYSEMASVTGAFYNSQKTFRLLEFSERERPYVVQIFGSDVDHFSKAIKLIDKNIGPDGFDINFGCPVKKVLKQGAGSKLMENLDLSRKIIETSLESTSKPISIKIRTEAFSVNMIDFLKNIKDLPVSALMIHGRTLSQLFSGPIDIESIAKSKEYFKGVVLANGGINSLDEARSVVAEAKVDGVGFARGALGNPWIFSEKHQDISKEEREVLAKEVAINHLKIVERNKGSLGLGEFKGHLAWYLKGFSSASSLRSAVMAADSFRAIEKILIQ